MNPLHCPLVYFRRSEQSWCLKPRTVDRAAPRYSPASLRGAADDPSLRNQLQQLFLSEDAGRPSNWALKSRGNSCSSPPLTLQTHHHHHHHHRGRRRSPELLLLLLLSNICLPSMCTIPSERNVKHPHHLPDPNLLQKINCPAAASLESGRSYSLLAMFILYVWSSRQ